MNNKIDADSWYISCNKSRWGKEITITYSAKIEYALGDEKNSVRHSFDTYEEAYQWIVNKVQL